MAITSSAKKAIRASAKKRVFNVRRARKMNDAIHDFKVFVAEKNKAEAVKLLPTVCKAIDKACKGNTIKKNTANRKKSRLMKMVNKLA